MFPRYLLPSVLLTLVAFAQTSWLEFNAGCPEGSEPLVQFNGRWDELLTFDVELRGLLADTVTVDSQDYFRFSSSPGTVPSDRVGFPELPVVRRMVWLPDDSDITLEYSANCCDGVESLPVYPAPLDSLVDDSTCTPFIGEYFRKDSSAYASDEWYPEVQAELVGEFRLRDLRVGIVDVYPVQYLASEDSLRVWSDIEVAISYDTTADWPTCNLGCYEALVGDRLLGYHPDPPPWAPVPGVVMRPADLVAGPARTPDYVILVASGLDGWWVDTLAHHRADLNGFDVAIVRTDSVLSQFSSVQAITPDIIRDFTEAMWDWGSAETKRPSYLLLIGDHEDPEYAQQGWFLPSKILPEPDDWPERASDGWFVGFGDDPEQFAVFPDMMVGRLPVRTSGLLQDMIANIMDFEAAGSWPPSQGLAWRRSLTHLAGHSDEPSPEWTAAIADWAGYSSCCYKCGDGDPYTSDDGSTMSSRQWCEACTDVFEEGAQIIFYAGHGAVHYFECGVDSEPGVPDSTFDNLDVDSLCLGQGSHGWPFVILGSCAQGTFNWTERLQYDVGYPPWFYYDNDSIPSDFSVNCFGEALLNNLAGGAIAVYGNSWSTANSPISAITHAVDFTEEALYHGVTRAGDIILAGRIRRLDDLWVSDHWSVKSLASMNLLGDPAVDIGDRVKFRNRCDLIVSPGDIGMAAYPTRRTPGSGDPVVLQVVVRNAGAVESGGFDAEMTLECGNYDTLLTADCTGIEPGREEALRFPWRLPSTVSLPATFTIEVAADPDQETPDSWFANNDASAEVEITDAFPNESGWPVLTPGSIEAPPCLVDLDGDEDLEIVAVCGMFCVCAYEPDGELIWMTVPPSPPDPGQGYSIPAAGSVCGGPEPEIVIDCQNHICIFDGESGEVLYSYEHLSALRNQTVAVTLADIVCEGQGEIIRDEIAFLCDGDLYLMRVQSDSLVLLDSEPKPSGIGGVSYGWVVACDLNGSAPIELVVTMTESISGLTPNSAVCLYRYQNGNGSYYDTNIWRGQDTRAIAAVGRLAGATRITLSRRTSNDEHAPAYILDTGLTLQDSCQYNASLDAGQILCCVMADWDSVVTGADAIVSPSENQAFTWRDNGQALSGWPESYDIPDSFRPPFPALGELDNEDQYPKDDLVVATRRGWVMAFSSGSAALAGLGFPYLLPSEVNGGFCTADIDGDERVELVFGTMDNYLHVWELGSCDEYFSPWPQCQHDAARTGVLE